MHARDFAPAADQRALRDALGRYATGVTVITTRGPSGKFEGLTANSFSAVSLDPPLVLWSLRRSSPSMPGFDESGLFAVNVLGSDQRHLSRHFSTPRTDKFTDMPVDEGAFGCPLIRGAIACFECQTEQKVEGGDHVIFIGRVLRAAYRDGEPLIFSAGRYATHALLDDETRAAAGGATP